MAIVDLEEAKNYLRVDTADDDDLISVLLASATQMCADVARLSPMQMGALSVNDKCNSSNCDCDCDCADQCEYPEEASPYICPGRYEYPEEAERREHIEQAKNAMHVSILYALGYLYEHREEADHHNLILTLRSLLFAVREEAWTWSFPL